MPGVSSAVADLLAQVARPADALARAGSPISTPGIAAYDALPAGTTDDDRFQALRAAETADLDRSSTRCRRRPAALRAALDAKRAAFARAATASSPRVLTRPVPRFADSSTASNALAAGHRTSTRSRSTSPPFGDRAVAARQDLAGEPHRPAARPSPTRSDAVTGAARRVRCRGRRRRPGARRCSSRRAGAVRR